MKEEHGEVYRDQSILDDVRLIDPITFYEDMDRKETKEKLERLRAKLEVLEANRPAHEKSQG